MRLTNKCSSRSLAIRRFALPAQVVKLVDTLASGASARKGVEVQVLSWAPTSKKGSSPRYVNVGLVARKTRGLLQLRAPYLLTSGDRAR